MHLNDGVGPYVDNSEPEAPVLDPVAAWYVTSILRDVPPPTTGLSGRLAFKTGTSYGYRDAWAVGYDGKTVTKYLDLSDAAWEVSIQANGAERG